MQLNLHVPQAIAQRSRGVPRRRATESTLSYHVALRSRCVSTPLRNGVKCAHQKGVKGRAFREQKNMSHWPEIPPTGCSLFAAYMGAHNSESGAVFRCAGSYFGCEADWGAPDPIRRFGPGVLPNRLCGQSRNRRHGTSPERANSRLIRLRAAQCRPWRGGGRDPRPAVTLEGSSLQDMPVATEPPRNLTRGRTHKAPYPSLAEVP